MRNFLFLEPFLKVVILFMWLYAFTTFLVLTLKGRRPYRFSLNLTLALIRRIVYYLVIFNSRAPFLDGGSRRLFFCGPLTVLNACTYTVMTILLDLVPIRVCSYLNPVSGFS